MSWATHRACQIPSVASHAVRERMLFGLASCQQHHADPSLTAAAPSKTTVSSPGWVALTIDGIRVGHHPVLALVIDKAGRKRILGLAEAATESCTMVKSLLIDWVERGLAIPNGTWP